MGIFASREARNADSVYDSQRPQCKAFHKALAALREGRYTDSELRFHQIIFSNPWMKVVFDMLRESERFLREEELPESKPEGARRGDGPEEGLCDVSKPVDSGVPEVLPSDPAEAMPNDHYPSPASDCVTTTTHKASYLFETELPYLDNVSSCFGFFQLLQEVELSYILNDTDKGRALAFVYSRMNSFWHQVTVYSGSNLRRARVLAKQKGIHDPRSMLDVKLHAGKEAADEATLDCGVELLIAVLRHHKISSTTNCCMLLLTMIEKLEDTEHGLMALAGKNGLKHRERIARRRRRACENISTMCCKMASLAWQIAELTPNDYVSRVLIKVLPEDLRERTAATASTEAAGHTGEGNIPSQQGTDTSNEEDDFQANKVIHVLSNVVQTFQTALEGKHGGTFHALSRDINLSAAIYLPLGESQIPMQAVVPKDVMLPKQAFDEYDSPHRRLPWHATGWVLPAEAGLKVGYPGTNSYLLARALPEHYTEIEGGGVAFSKRPIPGREPTPDKYIEMVIDYTRSRRVADDALRLSTLNSNGSSISESELTPNVNIDLMDPRMRELVCSEEYAVQLLLVLLVLARVSKLMDAPEKAREYASSAVLLTGCIRGPDSLERLRLQAYFISLQLL